MTDFVTALIAALTPAALWGALTPLAGVIGVVVIFSLSVHLSAVWLQALARVKLGSNAKEGIRPLLLGIITAYGRCNDYSFWLTAEKLTVLIVPIIALWLFFNLIVGILYGRR